MKLNEAYVKYTQKTSNDFFAQITEASPSRIEALKRANVRLYANQNIKEEEVVLS